MEDESMNRTRDLRAGEKSSVIMTRMGYLEMKIKLRVPRITGNHPSNLVHISSIVEEKE